MTLPVPTRIFEQSIILLGKTRSGKSSTARLMVEHLLDAGKPVTIIDPKGDWWGLKSSASGKQAGYPVVIFGGEHADVPLNPHAGAHVAEIVATGNRPCIIDLGGWTVRDRTQFFIDFASTLFKLTRGIRYLVIDEAHNFAPKGKVISPEAGMMLHWGNRLASEGAGKGLLLVGLSQRPQKVHNDFLTSCETLIAKRVIHKSDRDAVKDWIDGCGDPARGAEVLRSLAQMKREQAWVWSPEIEFGPELVSFPMFKTYDSFKAQPGSDLVKLKGWASVDLEEVLAKFAAVVQEAEANDPAKLKARIKHLEKEVAAKPAAGRPGKVREVQVTDVKAIERAIAQNNREWLSKVKEIEKTRKTMVDRLVAVGTRIDAVRQLCQVNGEASPAPITPPEMPAMKIESVRGTPWTGPRLDVEFERRDRRTAPPSAVTEGLTPAKQRIIDAIAWFEAVGIVEPSRENVAAIAGASSRSGGFRNNVSNLHAEHGFVSYPNSGNLELTDAGRAAANVPSMPPTLEALHQAWFEAKVITPSIGRILHVLIERHPEPITREELAALVGASAASGGFRNNVSRLSSLGLAVYPSQGTIRANEDLLFPEALL